MLLATLSVTGMAGAEAPPRSSPGGRTARAVFFKRPASIAESAVLAHAGGSIAITLPAMNLSEPVTIPDGDIVLAALPRAPTKDHPIPPGAPLVKIPAAWSQVLLLFFPDPRNKDFPVRVLPVDGSFTVFKPGDLLWLNLSAATVGGTLDKTPFRIPSGTITVVKPTRSETGDFPVAVNCLLKGETTPRPICRTTWRHDPQIRQLIFVINAEDRPVPRLWSVAETIHPCQ